MKRRRIIWVSRDVLRVGQYDSLVAMTANNTGVILQDPMWQGSGNEDDDARGNRARWRILSRDVGEGGIIAGMFPPEAIETVGAAAKSVRVLMPVYSGAGLFMRWAVIH